MPGNFDDRAAFLRAICAAPDDDAPRLIYADWLDEQGAEAQAAFIREQIRLARLPSWHPDVLEARFTNQDTFTGRADPTREVLPPLPEGLAWAQNTYVRGFPELVWLHRYAGGNHLGYVCREIAPIQGVHLTESTGQPASVSALFDETVLLSITHLVCHYQYQPPVSNSLRRLRASRYRGMIRRFTLRLPDLTEPDTQELLNSHLFHQLEGFSLHHYAPIRGEHFYRALRTLTPASCQLRQLRLDNVVLAVGHLMDLANTSGLKQLRELDLASSYQLNISDYWELLPNSRYLQNLEVLRCSGFWLRLSPSDLLKADRWPALRWLALNDNNGTADTVQVLLETPFLSRLTCLELAGNDLGDRGAKALARVEFERLAVLFLRDCSITNEGALALANAPFAAHLRVLNLTNNNLDDKTKTRLRDLLGPRVRL